MLEEHLNWFILLCLEDVNQERCFVQVRKLTDLYKDGFDGLGCWYSLQKGCLSLEDNKMVTLECLIDG